MAKRKSTAQKQAEKFIRKNKKLIITVIAVLLAILFAVGVVIYIVNPDFYKNLFGNKDPNINIPAGTYEDIQSADLSIHFLELGNKYTGDCTLIKVGDTEVLIDAGSRKGSAPYLKNYIDDFCTDGVLEYVIATHAHQDHIAAFVGSDGKGLLYQYEVGTLIQFARSEATSGIYQEYCTAVDYIENKGTKVYTALECFKEQNGAKKQYYLDAENTVSMNILYNYYYENDASTENDYSVCMLLSQELGEKDNHYLFTGDLEEDGEEKLVDYYQKSGNPLPKVRLFKGGHHGSYTANTDALLNAIEPDHVAICCCVGTPEYTKEEGNTHNFPAQEAIDRISKHTDSIYCTTLIIDYDKGQFASMNGNIIFYYLKEDDNPDGENAGEGGENSSGQEEDGLKLYCTNNNTKLKDSDWYKQNRG